MSRIIKWLDLWLITVVILSCIPAITKCEWTSLRNVSFDKRLVCNTWIELNVKVVVGR